MISSTAGGIFLWFYITALGTKAAVVALVAWFVSIPIAVAISMIANAVLAPLIALTWGSRNANALAVIGAQVALATTLSALGLYDHIPTFLGRLAASWWVGVWVACMASLFWFITIVEYDEDSELGNHAP